MTVKELYDRLSLTFPDSLRCDWDRDGLMLCADPAKPVRRVLTALDVTPAAVRAAIEAEADVIISHHPVFFHPLPALTRAVPAADKALNLLSHGISVMCFHTRADAAPGGVGDLLADTMELADVASAGENGILKIGVLPHRLTAMELAAEVKDKLATPAVTVADAGAPIRLLAVCGGEGGDMIEAAKAGGADALLAGRVGYHKMQDAAEAGLTVLEAGHWYTEIAVTALFARLVEDACGAEVVRYTKPPVAVV